MLPILRCKVNKIHSNMKEIIEEAKQIICYVAGKRAASPEDYFRHSVCEADDDMLFSLTREAMAWIAARIRILLVEGTV